MSHSDAAIDMAESLGADDPTIVEQLAEVCFWQGQLHRQRGMFGDAEPPLRRALTLARDAGATRLELDVLTELGFIEISGGNREEATHFQEGLDLAEQADDAASQATMLARLAIELVSRLELDEALSLGERALDLARPDRGRDGRGAIVGRSEVGAALGRRSRRASGSRSPSWRTSCVGTATCTSCSTRCSSTEPKRRPVGDGTTPPVVRRGADPESADQEQRGRGADAGDVRHRHHVLTATTGRHSTRPREAFRISEHLVAPTVARVGVGESRPGARGAR